MNTQMDSTNTKIWLGIAIGAAIGVGYAISRGRRTVRRDAWSSAKDITRRMADHSQDFAERSKEIIERMQAIYQEGRRVVEDATELWEHGRKAVGV
jgi:hypothetical protein